MEFASKLIEACHFARERVKIRSRKGKTKIKKNLKRKKRRRGNFKLIQRIL